MPGMKVRMEFAQKDEIAFRENERKMKGKWIGAR